MINIILSIWIFLGTIIGQIIILFIGYSFMKLLPKHEEFPVLQRLAISYGLGVGILTSSMFIFILLGLHSRFSFIPIILISLFLFLYLKMYKHLKNDMKSLYRLIKRRFKFNKVELFCLFLLLIELIYMILIFLVYPPIQWDSVVFWDAKARYIFFDGNFNFYNYYSEYYYYIVHLDYPLLVPLNCTFFYSIYFQPHHYVQLTFLLFFLSLIITIFYSLRQMNLNRSYALLISTIVALIWEIFLYSSQISGEIVLTFYYTVSTIFLSFYFYTRKRHYLIYSSIFMGFMALTKQEGVGLLIVNCGIFVFYNVLGLIKKETEFKQSIILIGIFTSIGLIIYLPWQVFSVINDLGTEYLLNIIQLLNFQEIASDILILLGATLLQILWSPFWIVFLILIVLNTKFLLKHKMFFLMTLCAFHLLVKYGIYLISPYDLAWQLATSLNREYMHLAPFAAFVLGIIIAKNQSLLLDIRKDEDLFQKKVVFYFTIIILAYITIVSVLFGVLNAYIPTALNYN